MRLALFMIGFVLTVVGCDPNAPEGSADLAGRSANTKSALQTDQAADAGGAPKAAPELDEVAAAEVRPELGPKEQGRRKQEIAELVAL